MFINLKKLGIGALGLASIATIPTTLSSCFNDVPMFNVLSSYTPGVKPYKESSFEYLGVSDPKANSGIAALFYATEANLNNEIINDDIIYGFSSTFASPKAKEMLEEHVKFKKYKIGVSTDIKENKNRSYINGFKMEAEVAGTGNDLFLNSDKTIQLKDFDLKISFSDKFHTPPTLRPSKYFDIPFIVNPRGLNSEQNLCMFAMPFLGKSTDKMTFPGGELFVETKGHISYVDNGKNITFNNYFDNYLIEVNQQQPGTRADPPYTIEQYADLSIPSSLFINLVFKIPSYALAADGTEYYPDYLCFASHFFKDVTMVDATGGN